tara:strand:- start:173 stop:502 length:330 start_codon:yes stop_codon:yes gene_type:complete
MIEQFWILGILQKNNGSNIVGCGRFKTLPLKALNIRICRYTHTCIHSYSNNAIHIYSKKEGGNGKYGIASSNNKCIYRYPNTQMNIYLKVYVSEKIIIFICIYLDKIIC